MTQPTRVQEAQLSSLITDRWSPRSFTEDDVSSDQLTRLLEAARRAPSSFNIQPWHFIYARKSDGEAYQNLFDCLMDANKGWAQLAPVLMISVTQTNQNDGNPNYYARHDVGMAMGNLLAQATYEGLAVHQMGGYHASKARENLNIPEGYEPVAMVAVGYQGPAEQLPEDLQKVESQDSSPRKDLSEFVFKGTWSGKPDILD
jgi:nitroreductase